MPLAGAAFGVATCCRSSCSAEIDARTDADNWVIRSALEYWSALASWLLISTMPSVIITSIGTNVTSASFTGRLRLRHVPRRRPTNGPDRFLRPLLCSSYGGPHATSSLPVEMGRTGR